VIEQLAKLVDPALMERSGSVFYSGRTAFSHPTDIYLIGINPGGDPVEQSTEIIRQQVEQVLKYKNRWSPYTDESWQGMPPGTYGMQPRVLHMLRQLGCDPRETPAIIVRLASQLSNSVCLHHRIRCL